MNGGGWMVAYGRWMMADVWIADAWWTVDDGGGMIADARWRMDGGWIFFLNK